MAGGVSFDDLIPQGAAPATAPATTAAPASAPAGGVSFDDLTAPPMFDDPITAANWAKAHPNTAPGPVAAHQIEQLSVLPLSREPGGSWSFDSNAGLVGMAKRALGNAYSAVTLPGDVYHGDADVNDPQTIGRAFNMASTFSPMNPAARAGVGYGSAAVLPGGFGSPTPIAPGQGSAFAGRITVPTTEQLLHTGGGQMDTAINMGVERASPAVRDMASGVQEDINSSGLISAIAPKTHALLNALQQATPTGPGIRDYAPFGNLDAARRLFGRIAFKDPVGEEREAAGRAHDAITGFLTNPDPGSVVAGPAQEAGDLLSQGIGNYAAGMRSDRLQGIERAGDLRAAAANTGTNIGNAIRQRAANLLLSKSGTGGFNPAEEDALNKVVTGTPLSNAARFVGNRLAASATHGASDLVAPLTAGVIGFHEAGPWGAAAAAIPPVVGELARHIDNAMTRGRLNAADALVRSRSPLAQALAAQGAPQVAPQTGSNALVRALMLSSGLGSP